MLRPSHAIGPDHTSVGSVNGRRQSIGGYPVENPPATLDPQNAMGAGTLYAQSVRRPDLLFPWARYPWMTIPGPQLRQAASVHNIWNAVPVVIVVPAATTVISQHRSNRIRSVLSHAIKLPSTGIFSTGGTS